MKFRFEMDSRDSFINSEVNGSNVVVEFYEEGLDEIQEYIRNFLTGCGFSVPDEDELEGNDRILDGLEARISRLEARLND